MWTNIFRWFGWQKPSIPNNIRYYWFSTESVYDWVDMVIRIKGHFAFKIDISDDGPCVVFTDETIYLKNVDNKIYDSYNNYCNYIVEQHLLME